MNLGRLSVTRRAKNDSEKAPPPPTPGDEQGASGVVNLSGFLQPLEYKRDLAGRHGLEVFEQMRSSDGAVQEALAHFTSPIRNATWDVEPASDQEEDLIVAEATRRAFFEWPEQPFSEYIDQALDYLVFGHMPFELVWHVVDDDLEVPIKVTKPGPAGQAPVEETRTIPTRQWLTFQRFAQRLPFTIWRWNVDGSQLVSITQQVWKNEGFEQVDIPEDQLVVYVNQKRGDDWSGRSLLRSAYKHFVMKEIVEKIEIVALERLGVGILVGYPSADRHSDSATMAKLEAILKDIRAGTHTYIVAPGPKMMGAAQGTDGFLFEILTPSGTPPDFKGAKEYHRGEIKGSMLVRFSELGHGQTGARAVGDVQSEVWKDGLHAIARHVAEVNDDPIRRFVQANFPGVQRFPKLVAHDIESRSLTEFADAHSKLVSSGAVEPDRAYRAFVREGSGAPPETDPDAIDEQLAAPQPGFDAQGNPLPPAPAPADPNAPPTPKPQPKKLETE